MLRKSGHRWKWSYQTVTIGNLKRELDEKISELRQWTIHRFSVHFVTTPRLNKALDIKANDLWLARGNKLLRKYHNFNLRSVLIRKNSSFYVKSFCYKGKLLISLFSSIVIPLFYFTVCFLHKWNNNEHSFQEHQSRSTNGSQVRKLTGGERSQT